MARRNCFYTGELKLPSKKPVVQTATEMAEIYNVLNTNTVDDHIDGERVSIIMSALLRGIENTLRKKGMVPEQMKSHLRTFIIDSEENWFIDAAVEHFYFSISRA